MEEFKANTSDEDVEERAKELYEKYFSLGSEWEVNADHYQKLELKGACRATFLAFGCMFVCGLGACGLSSNAVRAAEGVHLVVECAPKRAGGERKQPPTAQMQDSLTSPTRASPSAEKIQHPTREVFDDIQISIFVLMRMDSFPKFMESKEFLEWKGERAGGSHIVL